ncbi:MAG: efflux RND transporter periplasmic adaptor subunit [Lachnospiraceae bacterium]|nr:efflux RND transporter periplasmic adaptor subunit [Lachnospiraceae bacterium]MDE6231964.1 efflux RND transporter periplasmic adaptor subunit [Lachnospiraceae bacterium]MDE6252795.1 efflux RND transporter periplasmic adaptor subunit [Lachnospiraceae bacterium]
MSDDKIVKETSLFKRKRKLIIITAVLILIAVVCIFFIVRHFQNKNDENKAYVTSVAELTGYGSLGVAGRFTGVVESQKAITVNADSSKTIKTCFVNVGDQVTAGTQLFEYDTNEINLSIEEHQLEIDKLNIEINSARQQISQLESEKASAPADEQLSYTMQIQSLNTDIASNQYDVNSKQAELEKLKASLSNAIVTSTADGIIKSIGSESSSFGEGSDMEGSANETPYISILPLGDYQIKGILTELNMGDMAQGSNVIIRSRVDSSKSVKGTVSKIDFNNPISSSSSSDIDMGMEGGSSSGEPASKWYFYVTFENTENLILGQHVFIEPDYGQSESKEGLWISELFLGKNDDGSYFAWKEKKGKLVKQNLELGEYNSENMEYQILKGLTTDDYIAFPSDELFEGQSVTHSEDAIGNIGNLDQDIDMDNFDGDIDFDNVDGDGDVDLDNVDDDGDIDSDNVDQDGDIDSDNNDDEPDNPEGDDEEDAE